MRRVSAGLLAAQRVSPQRPRVRVRVRDKQPRPTLVGRQGTANAGGAACVTASGTRIVVAALGDDGCIRVRDVTAPGAMAEGSGWGWYTGDYVTVIAPGGALGWPNGDICISDNAGTLRLFYVKADGTEILAVERAGAGGAWGAPFTVCFVSSGGDPAYHYYLASGGNDDLWYTCDVPGDHHFFLTWLAGGFWHALQWVQYLVEGGGEYETCYGLAVQWDASINQYCIVASMDRASTGDGRIVSGWYDPLIAGGIHDFRAIVPPGYPMVGFVPWRPALLKTSGTLGPLWLLTYWDTFTSLSTSWAAPMAMVSRDFEHWSYRIPLSIAKQSDYRRISAVELGSVVYLHVINQAHRLDLWYAGKSGSELTVDQGKVLRYRIAEHPENGVLHVELDNRGGTYDHPGVAGEIAGPLRPLAQISIEQGLNTASGDVRVESRPFYLWSHSTARESGVNLVRLYAVDGWQLLRMWRPDCTIEWVGKTLGFCIAELASRVGNWEVVTDGLSEWSQVLNYLTVAASHDDSGDRWYIRSVGRWLSPWEDVVMFGSEMSGLTILHHLLALVGGAARFGNGDDREVLYVFIPQVQGLEPAAVHTYNDGEALSLQSVAGFGWPTRVLVSGSAGGYSGRDVDAEAAVAMDFLQVEYASQWATEAQLERIALGMLDDGNARAAGGWVKTRPNVGVELFDVILFSDLKAGGGLVSLRRRVNGLVTEYDPLHRVWQQTVYVEGT